MMIGRAARTAPREGNHLPTVTSSLSPLPPAGSAHRFVLAVRVADKYLVSNCLRRLLPSYPATAAEPATLGQPFTRAWFRAGDRRRWCTDTGWVTVDTLQPQLGPSFVFCALPGAISFCVGLFAQPIDSRTPDCDELAGVASYAQCLVPPPFSIAIDVQPAPICPGSGHGIRPVLQFL